eukprot:196245-Prymnesium_polylepis.1
MTRSTSAAVESSAALPSLEAPPSSGVSLRWVVLVERVCCSLSSLHVVWAPAAPCGRAFELRKDCVERR